MLSGSPRGFRAWSPPSASRSTHQPVAGCPQQEGAQPCVRLTAPVLARSLESVRQCGVALCIALGFSILTASRGSAVVRDRVTGAKRLQHISGLGHGTYWFASFLYDMVGLGAPSRGGLLECVCVACV